MKRRIQILIVLLFSVIPLFLSGCGQSKKEELILNYLTNKYGEEFIIHSTNSEGSVYHANCSPVAMPEVVFKVRIENDGTPDGKDNYASKYVSKLVNDVLKEDMKDFFPEAYCYTDLRVYCETEIRDQAGKSLQDIFATADAEKSDMIFYVFYDKDVGSYKKYAEEYTYFTETIDEYIRDGKAVPVTVSFYKVDGQTIDRLDAFLKDHEIEDIFDMDKTQEVFGVDRLQSKLGICSDDSDDLGNPPNISACFKKKKSGTISGVEEYIRRRELLEEK